MDPKHKMLLQQHQKDIVRDLDVTYIIDELYTREALSQDDFDLIVNLSSRVDRTRYLIDVLIQRGSNGAYKVFVDSLQKDHGWLWEKFSLDTMDHSALHDSLEDSLSRGDVPRLPDHYVQRLKEEQEVSSILKVLARHKLLALHGMSGCGKSSVAIGVLRNNHELIAGNFGGVVFWLNLGNVKTEDDIVAQQNKLYRKASTIYMRRDSSFMNSSISMSSIGSNDNNSVGSYDCSWMDLRDMLKTLFSEPPLKEALLVLDEVNEKKSVEAFDVGCKMLVTTRDTEVVARFHPQIVKIKNSLEESESLRLFASCLEVDVSQLPRQAKKLNEICQGSPFHVALIGAQLAENRERLIDDTRHWNHYIHMLRRKDFFFITRNTDNPMKTVEVCINSLKTDILPLFKLLAVLPDNVKVSSSVVSKLWNKPVREVEEIMSQLKSKSLIIQCYNQEQRNYNYEVHDLIMNYLRTCSTEEEVKKMHADVLKSYQYENLNNHPVDIVDDGYIAFYIGHHIFHTKNVDGKWALFQLYLNLKFLGNKVRLTGPADAIMDYEKYDALIAKTELDRELVLHMQAFLRTHGNDLHRFPRTDIVQSILQHTSKDILYTRAHEIALENCANNELYFDLLHEQYVEDITYSTIDVKESISSVCFLGDNALVGTSTGAIKFFQVFTHKLKKELPSAGAAVTWVATCPANALIVAALTSEGVVNIWYMDEMEHELSDNAIEEEPEEVSYDAYRAPETISPKLGPVVGCRWANNQETLLTHTAKMIILYGTDGKVIKVLDHFDRDKLIVACVPSNDDRHVLAATCVGTAYYIEVFDLATKERVVCFEEAVPVLDVLTVPGINKMLILNREKVLEHEFKIHSYTQHNYNTYSCKDVIQSGEVKEGVSFVTAVVNKSGSLLFISTDDSRIICIDLKTNSYVFDLDNRRGNVVCMAVSEVWYDEFVPGSDVLVSGTGASENSAKVWHLDAAYVSQKQSLHQSPAPHKKVRLTNKFDVSFLQSTSPNTPTGHVTPPSDRQGSTPKRHQSFVAYNEAKKRPAAKTMSLDRHSLKPLNLKGICNGSYDGGLQPLLAVVDDRDSIQIIRGRKVLTEIPSKSDDKIKVIKISPCNQYLIIGLQSGQVKKYTLRSKEARVIMDVYSAVQYLKFINPGLLVVAGKNKSLMAYRLLNDGRWELRMLQKGNANLGSQEILNDIQGNKKKNGAPDSLSQSGSEASITSKGRQFPAGDSRSRLCKGSCLVDCFWVDGVGMVTVENNATVKLWCPEMKLVGVLNGRQTDVYVNCAAYQRNVLVLCDDYGKFQAFSLREHNETHEIYLQTIQENKVNHKILSCDLTTDGHILAMGLDSGDVVIWNIPGKCQLYFLRHHKAKVEACLFSPVPDKLYRSNSTAQSPVAAQTFNYSNTSNHSTGDDEQPPLVLVTMASEIVWWNVTYLMRKRAQNRGPWRTRINVLTPIQSPMESRTDITAALENLSLDRQTNFFFGDGGCSAHDCWQDLWKRKTCKEGSKRKEILACIKLTGMNAKKLCHDDKFSCFVTVDNSGHIHIMNLMKPAAS